MNQDLKICAVMVTFQPERAVLDNIALLLLQVASLVVVDNGSNSGAVEMLRSFSALNGFALIENSCNQGIAAALNTGVRYSLSSGHHWVILFDQDSTVTPGFMDAMIDGYRKDPRRELAGIFCPHYIDRKTGHEVLTTKLENDGDPIVAMTTGSMMPACVFERCGWFAEELFVDQVDVEYCFRIRSFGYRVARCQNARLIHSAGAPENHRIIGLGRFSATHHGTERRYYITRNRLWVIRKYFGSRRAWCISILRTIASDTIKIILVEDFKLRKLKNSLLGMRDAVIGRSGKAMNL